jgi:ligand-binding SRPBCC domain-containing protein
MEIEFSLRLPVPRAPLFAFHANPENLSLLLNGWKFTEVLSTEGHIQSGARLRVREYLGPVPLGFVFKHFLFEPSQRFGERMVKGLFHRFEHVHEFEEMEGDPGA